MTNTKTHKKPLIPQLRFKEFDGEWEKKKTKDIAPLQRGFDLPTSKVISGKYPVVYSNGILRKHKEYKVKGPGIVTGRSGTIGKVTFVDENYWPHNTSLWVTDFCGNHPKYLYYFYCNFKLVRYNAGSTVPSLNRNNVHSVKKAIPSLKEQQKIATFLTAVDDKISQLTSKKEQLTQYKKGVMQQLFSQELRFKDENGSDFPDWEEKRLGEVSDVRDGTHESPKYKNEGYPLITSKNLLKNGSIDFSNVNLISDEDFLSINKRSGVNFGDILFGMIGTIGNPVIVKSAGFAIKNVALIKESDVLVNSFLIHFLDSQFIQKQFYEQNTGGTQKFLALGVIRDLIILTPSLKEQQKIASYLSALDGKIEAVQVKIEQTQVFKKGLLQQLFV